MTIDIKYPRKYTPRKACRSSINQIRSAYRNLAKGHLYNSIFQLKLVLHDPELITTLELQGITKALQILQKVQNTWNPHYIKERYGKES